MSKKGYVDCQKYLLQDGQVIFGSLRSRRKPKFRPTNLHLPLIPTTGTKKMNFPDLAIVYAEQDGYEWEDYLNKNFRITLQGTGDRTLYIHSEPVEKLSNPITQTKANLISRAKLQLIIITPQLLVFLQSNPGIILGKMFDPKRVIAILCGTDSSDVEPYRCELISYDSWQVLDVCSQTFVADLAKTSKDLMDTVERQQDRHKSQFEIIPCKVREGCDKVTLRLHEQLPPSQEIKVFLTTSSQEVKEVNARIRNPYNVQFVMPENFLAVSQIVSVQLVCDGISLGSKQIKCESKMGELTKLLQHVNTPFSFMCQTLGVTSDNLEAIDSVLVKAFQRNIPSEGFRLLDFSQEVPPMKSTEEMPTLIHFAAHYGLKELCSVLLDCPGADVACQLRNAKKLTPSEMAEAAGHKELGLMLEDYKMSTTANIYSILSNAIESAKIYEPLNNFTTDHYDIPTSIPINCKETNNNSMPKKGEPYLPMSVPLSSSKGAIMEPHEKLILGLQSYEPGEKIDIMDTSIGNDKVNERFRGYANSQVELLEILEEFKQNKYSLNEVEHLFEDWNKRHSAQTFKDKEEQLAVLRRQYEELQNTQEPESSLSKFFKYVSQFVGKSVKKSSSSSQKKEPVSNASGTPQYTNSESLNYRPLSTLSTTSIVSSSSSSSSDRHSTISTASSTYDSGILSDSEEHRSRVNSASSCCDHRASFHDNKIRKSTVKERASFFEYATVPPPVPVNQPGEARILGKAAVQRPLPPTPDEKKTMPFPKKLPINIEERKPMPVPRPDRVQVDGESKDLTSPMYISPDVSGTDLYLEYEPAEQSDDPSSSDLYLEYEPAEESKCCEEGQNLPVYGNTEEISNRVALNSQLRLTDLVPPSEVSDAENDEFYLPMTPSNQASKAVKSNSPFEKPEVHQDYYNVPSGNPKAVNDKSFIKNFPDKKQQKILDPYPPRKLSLEVPSLLETYQGSKFNRRPSLPLTGSPKGLPMKFRPLPEIPQ